MSKKNKNKNPEQTVEATSEMNADLETTSIEASSETDEDGIVTFLPGSSVIDIAELRRAQNALPDIDTDMDDLEEEVRQLKEEIENDPELQKDVLADFKEGESNYNLDNIASNITQQDLERLKEYEALAEDVSDELKTLNAVFIEEDKALESSIAREAALEFNSDDSDDVVAEEMSEEDAELRAALPQADEDGNFNMEDLQSCIGALLFYSDRPVSLKKLKEMLELPEVENEILLTAIESLKQEFSKMSHGFEVAEIAGGYQLRTKLSKAPLLRKLAKIQVQRLSRGAMETLTIVAYKQPCTKDDIDMVRGVDSSHFIRTLLDRRLIEVTGRSEAAGRPMIYATTDTFLEVFGVMDLMALPPLREIEAMVPQMVASEEGAEDPRVVQMRKMVNQMKTESNHLDYSAKEDEKILQEIRDRVKAIDITTPYLERQKQLAEQGITGAEAEELLAKEFGFAPSDVHLEETAIHDAQGDLLEAAASIMATEEPEAKEEPTDLYNEE